jgi:hypothetical protein
MHGEMRNVYKILVGKPDRMRSLGGPGHRWEDNIKIELRDVKWIDLAQDGDWCWHLVNMVMNLQIHQKARTLLTS